MRRPGISSKLALVIATGCAAGLPGPVLAFPQDDQVSGRSPAASGVLAAPDAQDLRQQLQLVGGAAGTPGAGGWIILPRIDVTGLFTDNALQVSSPRQWDVASILAPGIGIVADTNRLQMRFDYAPVMTTYARTSSQNSLSHYLNGTGLLTVVPEQVFVDFRAAAGVQPVLGGFGATGLGIPQAGSLGGALGNSALLSRDNQVQTFTAGISPYMIQQFGDYGTLRVGAGFQYARSSNVTGFGTLPFTSDGTNRQSLLTTEQTARFTTGEFLGRTQNTTDILLSQTPMSDRGSVGGRSVGNSYAARNIITNRTSYAINHWLTVFGTIGYEDIQYRGGLTQKTQGVTWDVGTTVLPNPDSSITLSYGKREGAESLALDARYVLTPRTLITASYSSRLTTQLQNLQRQLDQGVINVNGILVDSQTGAPLLIGNNGQAFQPGLFRYDTFSLSAQSSFARDVVSLGLIMSTQSAPNGSNTTSPTATARTVTASWTRELRPDLTLSTQFSFTTQATSGVSGSSRTIAGSVGLNYLMTETLVGRLRYSHFTRETDNATVVSSTSNRLNFSQNLITVGISKQF